MGNITVIKTGSYNLQSLITDIGFTIGNHPHLFTDCFVLKTEKDRKKLTSGRASGLSRTLGNLLPPKIDEQFLSPDELVNYIINDPDNKFKSSAAMVAAPEIVMAGIKQAIGFKILQVHPEIKKYPFLVSMHEVIKAATLAVQDCARGSHKGEHYKEVDEAARKLVTAQNNKIIPEKIFNPLWNYLSDQAFIQGDKKALGILINIYKELKTPPLLTNSPS